MVDYQLELDEITGKELLSIHALSVLVGNIYNKAYKEDSGSDISFHLLEAFKELRRCLPINKQTGKRFGSELAYKATQGIEID